MPEPIKPFNRQKFATDVFTYRNNNLEVSRHKFSEMTWISMHIINHIETAAQKNINIEHINRLCEMIGTNIYDYFEK